MATYYKIKDDRINLASAFERFQMLTYGNCIVQQGGNDTETEQDKFESWSDKQVERQRMEDANERFVHFVK